MAARYRPDQVMPEALGSIAHDLPYWFVIGGQAVRCFSPYRPSEDVDFGVSSASDLDDLIQQLRHRGEVELQERHEGTVHLRWNGIKVSAYVLPRLSRHVEDRHLDVTGLLATKVHAILDRGLRRDFFDLYVLLEQHRLGIAAVLTALGRVHDTPVDEGLLLRALVYFDDADREPSLRAEGPKDWKTVKDYFLTQVGSLVTPPRRLLAIQSETVDVRIG